MSALGSFVSGMFGLAGQQASFEQQKQLMEQQNQYNIDMWNMQNEYNSPAAQMRRFEEAGLNSALMYGQVTPGNANSAPVKQTPEAIKYEKSMRDLGQAFNIVQLLTEAENLKKAKADARIAKVEAFKAEEQQEALEQFGYDYRLDPQTGRYYAVDHDKVHNGFRREQRFSPAVMYYMDKILNDNFRTNYLLQPREALIQSQKGLNYTRGRLIAPQATMRSYEAGYYPFSFWFDRAVKGAQLVRSFLPY